MSAMQPNPALSVDPLLLLKLRLAVARHGEMDGSGWWNTRNVLGRVGKAGLSRGFPATHNFAQARIVFAVAAARCQEVFSPPGCHTLWNLTPTIEESLEARWPSWCRDPTQVGPVFEIIAQSADRPLLDILESLNAIDATTRSDLKHLTISAQGKAVLLPGVGKPQDSVIKLLAAAFSLGGKSSLAVPYLRAE